MALVVNDTVKKEWQKNLWLEGTNGDNSRRIFTMASHEYTNSNGDVVSVNFNAHTAWLWGEEGDLWSGKELRSWVKENLDGSFPTEYEEYIPIIPYGGEECIEETLEKFGLTAYKADIEERLQDLIPYGIERDSI